jgi:gluconate 2-dehydrogenase gamma chain
VSARLNRRELLALLGASGLAALACGERLPRAGRASQAPPKALTADQAALVAAAAECIIPTTGTPGAVEAGVPAFIDVIVGEWYDPTERAAFLDGLAALDARSVAEAGAPLARLTPAQQADFLTRVDAEVVGQRAANADGPTPFWMRFKSLTLYGYYTSEVGVTEELERPTIPGRFAGCEPLPAARPGAL